MARRVCSRRLKIGQQFVETELYIPPKPRPTYPNKLLFQNVGENTSRDSLLLYVERASGMEPTEVLYGDEPGTVLITFPEAPGKKYSLQ